jgi:hypothetical protein
MQIEYVLSSIVSKVCFFHVPTEVTNPWGLPGICLLLPR